MMEWSVVTAVNNDHVLESCLLSSPALRSATQVILQRGYASAAAAYNTAIDKATTDLLVFVHQDVYLPEGWINALERTLGILTATDPNWGVLGVWGVPNSGGRTGYLYWTGLPRTPGRAFDGGVESTDPEGQEKPSPRFRNRPFEGVVEVTSLDEAVLIFRKSSELRFDERLPGYHLYGTDICLESKRRERKCYAISAFCIHNTDIGNMLPLQFWKCYWFLRCKWKTSLPIITPCTEITYWCWPVIRWHMARARNLLRRSHAPSRRVSDPGELYSELVRIGLAPPAAEPPHNLRTDVRARPMRHG